MKKNKSTKILLATMTIPLAVSALPVVENVSANEIPSLHVYEVDGSPKLEWATEIIKENILTKTSFEVNDEAINLTNKKSDGQQEITNEDYFSGGSSLKVGNTTPNLGNYVYHPQTFSDISQTIFVDKKYIPIGEYMSVSMKVKTDKEAIFTPFGRGGKANVQITFDEFLNSKVPFNFSQNVVAGQNYFYVTNPEEFKGLVLSDSNLAYYSVSNKSTTGDYDYLLIKDVDINTGKVTVADKFKESFNTGEKVLAHRHIDPLVFEERIINTNEWQTINFNGYVEDLGYDTENRGFQFWLRTVSSGNTYIDDVTFGYATEVEVFRDGKSIYKGFLADFHDKSVKDNVKPNKVTKVNGSITTDFNVKLNALKPQDNGAKTSYQIQSIAKNGTRSALSTPQEIEVKTDVVKYKYIISNQAIGTPTIETNSLNDITIPLKSINLENDYLHIQAVDTNGNLSDISSFKLNELVDMQDLYDKVKELESSNDYNDFVDFIDEIEQLYGDNLPQDLKEMIDKLGQHHGVNTSFLLLEEGDFRLSTVDIESFGKVKLTAKKQTLTTAFKGDFGVIDARGTQEGWHVSVSATPFTVETFDGFVGTPHQLPLGSLALNGVNNVEQVGQVHSSQVPTITLNQLTAIDGQNTTVNLLNAAKQKGMGEFKFSFDADALALTVDAVTAKIDSVNYPDQHTPYASTVTWDLVSGPQI